MLYAKGALKLHELETMIGRAPFMEFLRKTAFAKVADTDQLLKLLSTHTTPEISVRFLASLKE
jgi:aminopeptidase N